MASGRPCECGVHMEGAVFHKTHRGGHGAGLPRGAGRLGGWEVHVSGVAHQHARVGQCAWWHSTDGRLGCGMSDGQVRREG